MDSESWAGALPRCGRCGCEVGPNRYLCDVCKHFEQPSHASSRKRRSTGCVIAGDPARSLGGSEVFTSSIIMTDLLEAAEGLDRLVTELDPADPSDFAFLIKSVEPVKALRLAIRNTRGHMNALESAFHELNGS